MGSSLRVPLVAAALTLSASAGAVEVPDVAGEPMLIDITNTAVGNYRFDNRNDNADPSQLDDVGTRVDDFYGEWLDRLNIQATWWRLRASVRVDAATFIGSLSRLDAKELAYESVAPDATGHDKNDYANRYLRDLNTRFLNTYYPSKLSLGYTQPGIDATLGDFYVQLGRGLVFSVRKVDELAVDTTVRGVKLVLDREFGPINTGLTAFAGQLNPVRVDETSGRRLHGDGSPLFFGFPRGRDLVTYEFDDEKNLGAVRKVVQPARPSYLEDSVVGGGLKVGPSLVSFGLNGMLLLRKSYVEENRACEARGGADCAWKYPVFEGTNPARLYDTIRSFSGSMNIPSIFGHGDLYVEVAGQQLRDGRSSVDEDGNVSKIPDLSGYAVYVSANARGGPITLSLEGKHYRSFLPLSANIERDTPGFSAPEFDIVAYNQPPTVEPFYTQQLGSPNICITGGRARVDARLTRQMSVYAWLGRYVSFSEHHTTNVECDTSDEEQTNTWDTAVGSEIEFDGGRSHSRAWAGARIQTHEVPTDGYVNVPGTTDVFYQEGYLRYDFVKHLGGPFSLQFQGVHRHRHESAIPFSPWWEGENYTALQWSPHISAIMGYEYVARQACRGDLDQKLCHFVSGGLQWKSASNEKLVHQLFDTVNVFVGQRRGGIRCVSGTCRLFPPFEGAKIEIVSRF